MSNEALTAVSKSEIKPSGRKFVLMALADYADEAWSCFPSVEQLAAYTSQGEKTVRDHLDALDEAGIISRDRHRREDGTLGRYRFVIHRRNLPVAKIARGEKPSKPPADFATHNPHKNPHTSSLRSDEVALAIQAYSEMAGRAGLPKPRVINDQRRRKISTTLKAYSLDLWREAVAAIEASDFCRGHNNRGWVADLDFMLQRKSFDGLIEGKYANRQPRGSPPRQQKPLRGSDHFFASAAQDIENEQRRNDQGQGGDWDDARGFPVLTIEHRAADG